MTKPLPFSNVGYGTEVPHRVSGSNLPSAVAHYGVTGVISRGNYRKEFFLEHGSGASFEATLIEAIERCGWEVYAYVIMSNPFHLAIWTPEPNLVAGMKWLQGVFASRFNRYRGKRGHVFQGHYKSLLFVKNRKRFLSQRHGAHKVFSV